MSLQVLTGDCREVLKTLPDQSVHCCVTSPPYWGLRDYGVDGQAGLEKTPEEYVAKMVSVFGEVRRVLRDDGTLWLNLGDSFSVGKSKTYNSNGYDDPGWTNNQSHIRAPGFKPKDLVGIPWRVAFALQADGWYLRSDIIWAKPNPMPESVTDRPTKSHEYIFLLSKKANYYYDAEAIKEPASQALIKQIEDGYNGRSTKDFAEANAQDASGTKSRIIDGFRERSGKKWEKNSRMRVDRDPAHPDSKGDRANREGRDYLACNKRDVWTVATNPYRGAHFATFPVALIKPCILAGCPVGGIVLDPFGGSGTAGAVALELGRNAILIELNPDYVKLIRERCNITPGLNLK